MLEHLNIRRSVFCFLSDDLPISFISPCMKIMLTFGTEARIEIIPLFPDVILLSIVRDNYPIYVCLHTFTSTDAGCCHIICVKSWFCKNYRIICCTLYFTQLHLNPVFFQDLIWNISYHTCLWLLNELMNLKIFRTITNRC